MHQIQATMLKIQAMFAGLTLNGNNKRPEAAVVRTGGLAQGDLLARQNCRGLLRHHPDSDDDS